ncbi:MAG: NHLP family bacteriocin export ABC transporter peptidase/permease/ATPase subunit [Bacteroidales bacterium]|nr:NHLP family bacteriocin export ABC transporter peptidase/permease/ATPase subunit [Bacteroidales bacterium]MDD4671281.1 NHLP family bacteriocin export ABC transporter peptidase/permease/ATPase subunit [Bacteroidales bacterium]
MGKVAKVPVVMQMEALECGAASLCMILAYYGKWVSLEQMREDCGVSRDGSNAKNILQAARNYGMEAKGYRFETDEVAQINFPCIIHWNLKHYVVLCGFRNGRAIINDPAKGNISVSMCEFDISFTGIALIFSPTGNFQQGGSKRSIFKFARERLRGAAVPISFIMLAGLITAIIGVANPAIGKVFVDEVFGGRNPEWAAPLIWVLVVLFAIYLTVSLLSAIYLLKIRGKMAITSSTSFFWHLIRLPINFFSQRYPGDLVLRQESNETIPQTLISSLAPVLVNFLMVVIFVVVMLEYNVVLTLIAVSSALLNIFLYSLISKKRVNITRQQMINRGNLSSVTVSGIEMIETIKSAGAEDAYFERWAGIHALENNANVRYMRINYLLGAVPGLVQQLMGAAILIIGALLIMRGEFTIGSLFAFQGFMTSMMTPFSALVGMGQNLQEMRTSMERVEDVMKYRPDVEVNFTSTEGHKNKLRGEVELKNVTFGYSRLGEPTVKDISIKVERGSKIAIVGGSGSGKSTIAKLICGLYKPWSGEILFDGKPRESYPREVMTGSIGVVDQNIIMFEGTVADNIKMWDESIKDFEMILAARDAQIHNEIVKRNGGFECEMLEGGKNFSGGQCQRIEIARVLAQDPTIMILDEATNSLDSITEHNVVEFVADRGITTIVVAHRLSTIRDCSCIIVLDNGEIVERGRHEDLMKMNGLYTKLVTSE